MCGIAGVLTRDVAAGRSAVEEMNGCQVHRGPDHAVVVEAGGAVLGNTRLAINDVSPEGNQPLWSPTARHCVVFNGEIYNFVELRRRYALDTPNGNDGAVIPLLWERLGAACLRELRGMFAVAVVDTVERTLTLARDPFGIKPLVWASTADGMAFASEPRALASATGLRTPSRQALVELFRFGAPRPETAPFEGMQVVPPNTWVRFDDAGAETGRGDVLEGNHPLVPERVDSVRLGELFTETVNMHLRSDVPVALLLSGGVDSALVARAARAVGVTLDCVTATTGDDNDEGTAARRTAALYCHRHHEVHTRLEPAVLSSFFAVMQRPSVDGLNTFVVAKAVADAGLKVALSGLGGDEALGGYRHFRLLRLLPLLRRLDKFPTSVQQLIVAGAQQVAPGRWEKHLRLVACGGPRAPASLGTFQRELYRADRVGALLGVAVSDDVQPERGDDDDFLELVEAEVRNYLQTTLLPDADAFSMAHSVELRVPFLDVPLFGASVRASAAVQGQGQKEALVREAGDDHIRRLASLPKRGFMVPVARLLRQGSELMRALDDRDQPLWSYVDRDVAHAMLRDAPAHRWAARWSFVVANAWLQSLEHSARR